MDDDGSGWNEVLVGGWTPAVRHRCVGRVEVMTRGWRNALIRTLTVPDQVPDRWTEALHRAVLTAIEQETGADLDLLGSHAAWACYEDVWDALARRWRDGGHLPMVPLDREPRVAALIAGSPDHVAEAVGADITGPQPVPLWIAGRLRVDVDGLRALRDGPHPLTPADLLRIETLLDLLPRR
jgi:hypothetical protein